MADKSRSIQTKFWYDTWVESLNITEKLLYLYLLTNPLTNLLGIYEISLKRISDESGISKEMIRKGLKRFANDSRAFFVNDNYIILPNFLKNQRLNANMQKGVENLFRVLPKSIKNTIIENGSESFGIIRNGLLKYEREIEREIEREKITRPKFIKPIKTKLDAYCKKMNYRVNTEKFLAHYNSNGWKVGKNPMKSWESALTTWHLTENNGSVPKAKKQINHYVYKCPSCRKVFHLREMRGDDYNAYRCDENDCQKVGLGKDGKNMVGYALEFVKSVYKE